MNDNQISNMNNNDDTDYTPSLGQGAAHSKIILMGEHAVVYGVPAIAMPFKVASVSVKITPSKTNRSWLKSDYYSGPISLMPDHMANLKRVIELMLDSFNLPTQALHYQIESNIPIGRGMGSSAAVSVAIARAIADFYDVDLSDYQLQLIVNQGEVIAHESTSGLDTLMSSTNDPVMYQKSEQPVPFSLNLKAFLILADSGIEGQTKKAVASVRQLLEERPKFVKEALNSIERFVKLGYQAILNKDVNELGRLLTYNHYYLNQLGVSHPTLDRIIQAAWYAGALGAKLTGGGLGGCAIALAETAKDAELIAEAMEIAGAKQTWILNLESE